MKITALVVAAALATTSAFAADTPALRALADGTEADAQLPADAPMEGADQQEWGGGWGRPGCCRAPAEQVWARETEFHARKTKCVVPLHPSSPSCLLRMNSPVLSSRPVDVPGHITERDVVFTDLNSQFFARAFLIALIALTFNLLAAPPPNISLYQERGIRCCPWILSNFLTNTAHAVERACNQKLYHDLCVCDITCSHSS
ncbi:hypothetical protein PC123_g20133 [Phytophthora cactorum]|nr:hypothetical protein PC123_g20133 [Phytophthora cactorum]